MHHTSVLVTKQRVLELRIIIVLVAPVPPPEMVATQEQMNLAQLPLEQRDYCAHHLLKLMKCKRDNWPNILACKHERHDWDYCQSLE